MSGIAGFFVQRIFRGAFDDKGEDHTTLLLHGPWVTGLMMTALTWFMAMKGLKGISFIEILRAEIIEQYGTLPVLLGYWALQETQDELKDSKKWQDPFFWAPIVMMGQ
jgi:hypothetical protein